MAARRAKSHGWDRETRLDFELAEEHRMLKDLVARFVRDELMPLEAKTLEREASGKGLGLEAADSERLDKISRELGLWGLDAPEDIGGSDRRRWRWWASR